MKELDGADAGGQFLRTALVLAAIQGERVRIENVRGDRPKPGLRPQHLAVLETIATLCDAEVEGASVGAETVVFDAPGGTIPGGEYAVDLETAGSLTLLFTALLGLSTRLESPLSVTATGGTDVAWSPPMDYFRYVTLPMRRRFGYAVSIDVHRRGFYPAGGGAATLHLAPSRPEPLDLCERGPLEGVRLYSTESASLADREVVTRQVSGVLEGLEGLPTAGDGSGTGRVSPHADDDEAAGLEVLECVETTTGSDSVGSAIVVRLDHATGVAGFSAYGERRKPAERVGREAAEDLRGFLESPFSPIDRHAADQLLVPLAMAGGSLCLPSMTDHVASSVDLLEAFGVDISIELTDDAVFVRVDR